MEKEELVPVNRDGKRMPATLRTPEGRVRGTVVMLHGLGGWKDQPLIVRIADALASEGYRVFTVSDSNSVASPDGAFFTSTQSAYERDVEDALSYLEEKNPDTQPLILIGHSMGGLAALDYTAKHPEQVLKLILIAPAISTRSMWWAQLPFALFNLVRGHQNVLGIDGKKFALSPLWWKDFAHFDGFARAREVMIPALVISAEKDHTVAKPGEHRKLTRKLARGEHSTISWADHDFSGHEDEVIATITPWLTSS